jgi:uncharacterized membrane protein YphA (DoxX/SURF4 family)
VVDPALALLIAIAFAVLYAQAAWHKLRAPAEFAAVLEAYALLPESAVPVVARALPVVELAIAMALCLPGSSRPAATAAAALLLLYALAMGINLARGRYELDCGCLGPYRRRRVSTWMVARNIVLATTVALAALPRTDRSWSSSDAWTIAAGVLAAALLYSAIDRLIAERDRYRARPGAAA